MPDQVQAAAARYDGDAAACSRVAADADAVGAGSDGEVRDARTPAVDAADEAGAAGTPAIGTAGYDGEAGARPRVGARGRGGAYDVRDARGAELVAGCELVACALDFGDRDALAPWLVQTAAGCGGLALGAFAGPRLIGFSFALPAAGGELFSCGLAVDPAWRGRGVGRALKLAQRDRALAEGCTCIRWTADPLSAPALALYLSGLGARLVAYKPELYAAVRPSPVPPDDVVIAWSLAAIAASPGPAARVEIPFDRRALDASELRRWRLRVRGEMTRTLASGAFGSGVAIDRAARRAWVLFSVPA